MLVSWDVKRDHSNEISIEHIYPQNPASGSKWENTFSSYDEEKQNTLRGSIGNLLLLSVAKNASLQNDEYSDKVNGRKNDTGEDIYKGYKRGSHSETDVAAKYPDWNAQTILKRGVEIIRFMECRWDIKFSNEDDIKELLCLKFV